MQVAVIAAGALSACTEAALPSGLDCDCDLHRGTGTGTVQSPDQRRRPSNCEVSCLFALTGCLDLRLLSLAISASASACHPQPLCSTPSPSRSLLKRADLRHFRRLSHVSAALPCPALPCWWGLLGFKTTLQTCPSLTYNLEPTRRSHPHTPALFIHLFCTLPQLPRPTPPPHRQPHSFALAALPANRRHHVRLR